MVDINAYFTQLNAHGFEGDTHCDYADRIVAATDNSVYQVLPEAIIFPKTERDITLAVKTIANYPELSLTARGGNTGTNGQSLSHGVILDTSRYLTKILDFDPEKQRVRVQPGVVLDQLNAFLKPHGLFFPPNVSTASRATIGGMIATDASGKGSKLYGKTSDYIHQLNIVLSDGSEYATRNNTSDNPLAAKICRSVHALLTQHQTVINQIFPDMNRGLTGYNLQQSLQSDQQLDLNYLLAGSEGTLALTQSIELNVIPQPKYRSVVAIFYSDFQSALHHVNTIAEMQPAAIEILDDKILQLAQSDSIWQDVESIFEGQTLGQNIKGLNVVEFVANDPNQLDQQSNTLINHLNEQLLKSSETHAIAGFKLEKDPAAIASLWNLRKKSVGLLGALDGNRRAVAFVEDTAVPPEKLADFVAEFRAILDAEGLDYGMFGHADVGCLHVRPTLDMRREEDQLKFRLISDQVAQLTKSYGGLLWGEHGRGYRAEYSPLFFGPVLTPVLSQIKALFDPNNRFNPSKLATPNGNPVTAIDAVDYRGDFDSQLDEFDQKTYALALKCNGNGACFSWDVADAMCPSYKATKNKALSPKGRAALFREWARLKHHLEANTSADHFDQSHFKSIEAALFHSLQQCLSCKSCTFSCPVKVDIPEMKAQFLNHYHKSNQRSWSDKLLFKFETLSHIGRSFPTLSNVILQNPITKACNQHWFGLIDSPQFSRSLNDALTKRKALRISATNLPEDYQIDNKSVILIADSFTASFDNTVLIAAYDLLTKLGYCVWVSDVQDNGKVQHVKGNLSEFVRIAEKQVEIFNTLASLKKPLISVEVASRLLHQHEYPETLGYSGDYQVHSIESFLAGEIKAGDCILPQLNKSASNLTLLPHCMEQTGAKKSSQHWQTIFAAANLALVSKNLGCCGMAGAFGHEKQQQHLSQKIYQLQWEPQIANSDTKTVSTVNLVSGFSCRSQTKRYGHTTQSPITWLNNNI